MDFGISAPPCVTMAAPGGDTHLKQVLWPAWPLTRPRPRRHTQGCFLIPPQSSLPALAGCKRGGLGQQQHKSGKPCMCVHVRAEWVHGWGRGQEPGAAVRAQRLSLGGSSEGPFLGGPPRSSGATRALNRVKEQQICLQRGFSSITRAMERLYPGIQLPPDLCRLWMPTMPCSLTPGSDLSPLTPHPLLPSPPGRGWEANQSQRPLAPPLASMTWNV